MTDRGLFLGRFQPMHLGHLAVLKRIAAEHDEVLVGIGSANVSHTPTNPFTGGERLEMVHGALREARLGNVLPVPIPDIGRNTLWVSHVESLLPRFGVLYTNNPLPARLFRERGHEVRPAPFHERDVYSGTRIRDIMASGSDEWMDLLPPAVVRVLRERDAVARLRELSKPDGVVEGSDPSV
jgi:nicotinamide-nucleotide adenylyltransferase